MTYAATGQAPQDMLDYFFPPTGSEKGGVKDRRNIPGYIKDVLEYAHAPIGTLTNKVHPLISELIQLHNNRDYYGGTIYDPQIDDPIKAYAEFLLNEHVPFVFRNQGKLARDGATPTDQALAFWGFGPAPQAIVNAQRGDAFQARSDMAGVRRREKEQGRITLP
jgi:hypothetical protein